MPRGVALPTAIALEPAPTRALSPLPQWPSSQPPPPPPCRRPRRGSRRGRPRRCPGAHCPSARGADRGRPPAPLRLPRRPRLPLPHRRLRLPLASIDGKFETRRCGSWSGRDPGVADTQGHRRRRRSAGTTYGNTTPQLTYSRTSRNAWAIRMSSSTRARTLAPGWFRATFFCDAVLIA